MIAPVDGRPEGERSFVAEEFLTWLWWQCETQGGVFDVPGVRGGVNLAIEDDLVLRGDSTTSAEGTLRGGVPTRSSEAAAALAAGKRLARAKLVIATHEREWTVKLDAASFQFRSARVPQPDGDGDPDLEAFQSFEDLADVVDSLFGLFLAERLSPSFSKQSIPGLRDWIGRKLAAAGYSSAKNAR